MYSESHFEWPARRLHRGVHPPLSQCQRSRNTNARVLQDRTDLPRVRPCPVEIEPPASRAISTADQCAAKSVSTGTSCWAAAMVRPTTRKLAPSKAANCGAFILSCRRCVRASPRIHIGLQRRLAIVALHLARWGLRCIDGELEYKTKIEV